MFYSCWDARFFANREKETSAGANAPQPAATQVSKLAHLHITTIADLQIRALPDAITRTLVPGPHSTF